VRLVCKTGGHDGRVNLPAGSLKPALAPELLRLPVIVTRDDSACCSRNATRYCLRTATTGGSIPLRPSPVERSRRADCLLPLFAGGGRKQDGTHFGTTVRLTGDIRQAAGTRCCRAAIYLLFTAANSFLFCSFPGSGSSSGIFGSKDLLCCSFCVKKAGAYIRPTASPQHVPASPSAHTYYACTHCAHPHPHRTLLAMRTALHTHRTLCWFTRRCRQRDWLQDGCGRVVLPLGRCIAGTPSHHTRCTLLSLLCFCL